MDLRVKTFLIISGVFAIFIACAAILSSQILLKRFEKVESDDVQLSAERVREAFSVDLDNLSTKLSDWAVWDDSYTFVTNKNQEFITSNITPESLGLLKVNIMIFINSKGEIIDARYYDYASGSSTFSPVPNSLLKLLTLENPLLQFSQEDHKEGLLNLPEWPLYVASRPILHSDGSGPPAGTIIFGRFLDNTKMRYFSDITHFRLMFFRTGDTQVPADILIAENNLPDTSSVTVLPLDEKNIAGYFPLFDIYKQPIGVVRLETERHIALLGRQGVEYFILGLSALGLLSLILIISTLDFSVISPITKLRQQIGKIRISGLRVSEKNFKGEFLDLATDINEMLDALKLAQEQLSNAQSIAHIGGWQLDLVTNVLTWSDEAYAVCGVSRNSFTPSISAFEALISDEDRKKFHELFISAIQNSKPFHTDFRLIQNGNFQKVCHFTAKPIFSDTGKFISFIGVIQDITELKRVEETVLKRSQELEQVNRFMVDRELRMTELKQRIVELEQQLAEAKKK